MAGHGFAVGQTYRILLRQRGLKSKRPWVAAEFTHTTGKVNHESHGADGKVYMVVTIPEVVGKLIFRVDETRDSANGPVAQATLFLFF